MRLERPGRVQYEEPELIVRLRLTGLTMMHQACSADDAAFAQSLRLEFDMPSQTLRDDGGVRRVR